MAPHGAYPVDGDDRWVAIASWTANRDGEIVERALQELGVPAHRVLYAPDVAAEPQLAHRRAFSQVTHQRCSRGRRCHPPASTAPLGPG
jgi:crotonobetainyl-CoA:carnitine CoA-transferase CaiB-like acyl-CoA transferase